MHQQILQTLEKRTSQLQQQDLFGMYIASSLRKMNFIKADLAKLEIVKVMTQVQFVYVKIALVYGSSAPDE